MEQEKAVRVSAAAVERALGGSGDLARRELALGGKPALRAVLFYIDGLVSGESAAREVIAPAGDPTRFAACRSEAEAAAAIAQGALFSSAVLCRERTEDVVTDLLAGFCALILEREGLAFCLECKSTEQRGVEAPTVEKSVKAPKEAFTENYRVNTSLLRRRLRDPALRLEERTAGRRSHSRLSLCYLEGLTDPRLVEEARKSLDRLDPEAILSSGSVEELLGKRSLFPQLLTTERPDKLALGLLEGRAAILVEGLPLGFLLPGTFGDFFRVPEDHSVHWLAASFLTLLRYAAAALSVLLPGAYVAIAVYHRQMIPIKLLLSIIASRQDVPFSTAAEVLGMLLAFELLQEAGLRLPQTVGQTVSIIGGLVVGQAAVEAKVISPVVVIVVALAGTAGFTVPNHDMALALRLCRLGALLLSIGFGLYGLLLGLSLLLFRLASLECCGVAYMQPFVGGGGLQALVKPPLSSGPIRKRYLTPGEEGKQG